MILIDVMLFKDPDPQHWINDLKMKTNLHKSPSLSRKDQTLVGLDRFIWYFRRREVSWDWMEEVYLRRRKRFWNWMEEPREVLWNWMEEVYLSRYSPFRQEFLWFDFPPFFWLDFLLKIYIRPCNILAKDLLNELKEYLGAPTPSALPPRLNDTKVLIRGFSPDIYHLCTVFWAHTLQYTLECTKVGSFFA